MYVYVNKLLSLNSNYKTVHNINVPNGTLRYLSFKIQLLKSSFWIDYKFLMPFQCTFG